MAAMELMGSTMHHMLTALEILLQVRWKSQTKAERRVVSFLFVGSAQRREGEKVARERYNSPSVKQQRNEMKAATLELMSALSDWSKFVEALSKVADKFKFADSEVRGGSGLDGMVVVVLFLKSFLEQR